MVEADLNNQESIKLYKNETIKGGVKYNWDIKLLGTVNDDLIKRLNDLNTKMLIEWGNNDISID